MGAAKVWFGLGLLLCVGLGGVSAQAQDRNWSREVCYGPFVPFVYNYSPLSYQQSHPGVLDQSSACSVGGRTGHASVGPEIFDGDMSVYTWVCNEGGENCGQDRSADDVDVQCFGEVRSRDGDAGTPSEDGALVFTSREPSIGEETRAVPMDENAVVVPQIQDVRVVCWHTTHF